MQIVLELIEVEAEVAPRRLWATSSRHRRLPDSRHQEGAQQAAGLLAKQALGQRDEEDATLLHTGRQIDGRSRLSHDVAHSPPQQYRPQLVEQGANHLEPLAIRHLLVLVPKRTEADGVAEVRSEDLPSLRLEQEQRDLTQAAPRTE